MCQSRNFCHGCSSQEIKLAEIEIVVRSTMPHVSKDQFEGNINLINSDILQKKINDGIIRND